MDITNMIRRNTVQPIENFILGYTKSIKLVMLDTGITYYAKRTGDSLTVGKGDNKRKYIIDNSKINNKCLYYFSECAEPVTVELDLEKSTFVVNSKQFDSTFKNKLIRQMYLSAQVNDLKLILYIAIAHMAWNIATYYEII